MTLTETLNHLLSVFLRPLRSWIERSFIAPFRSSYDAILADKESKVAAVYNDLEERLVNVEEGVPVRPLPAEVEGLPSVRDLNHLRASVGLLAERKIEDASPDIPDGVSLVRLLCDSSLASQVTEIIDTNTGWTWNKNIDRLSAELKAIHLNCAELTTSGGYRKTLYHGNPDNVSIYLDELKTVNIRNYNAPPLIHAKKIYFTVLESGYYTLGGHASYYNDVTEYVYLGCYGKTSESITLYLYNQGSEDSVLTDVELRDGARQAITLQNIVKLTAENIVNHIFNRLADNNDGDPITITLGSTNLAKLTDEEKHIAIDKNYILA